MNGPHDVGGDEGHLPPSDEHREHAFRAGWERRVQALFLGLLAGGVVNGDEFRHAVERLDRRTYLTSAYYERWVLALTALLLERDVVTWGDLHPAEAGDRQPATRRCPSTARVMELVSTTASLRRPVVEPPRFALGDRVVVRNTHPIRHTRCPRYLRGRSGTVVGWHGAHVFPDSHAHHRGEDPRHLYTVEFGLAELWGPESGAVDQLSAALWEPYLCTPPPERRT